MDFNIDATLDPNKNYYTTFEEAHEVAKKLIRNFAIQTIIGFDKRLREYTLDFGPDGRAKFEKAHPVFKRN